MIQNVNPFFLAVKLSNIAYKITAYVADPKRDTFLDLQFEFEKIASDFASSDWLPLTVNSLAARI